MKKRICIPAIIVLSLMLFIGAVNAQITIATVTVRTDKPRYLPGESGKIYITYYNPESYPVSIDNITIVYGKWQAYIGDKWVGNETIGVELTPVEKKGIRSLTPVDFTVPNDGRAAESCDVTVKIGTSAGFKDASTTIYIAQTPYYMQQIITLLTILVILLIVCTIIISATIFLSTRKPQVTRRETEKPE